MSLAAQLFVCLIIDMFAPQESLPYIPKAKRKRTCKFTFPIHHTIERCTAAVMTRIGNIKVRSHYRPPGLRYSGPRYWQSKKRLVQHAVLTGMTTTWDSGHTSSQGTFNSDAQALMLDDGASACITNDKEDFVEPPKRVDRKVKRIKGHANATHRGTLK